MLSSPVPSFAGIIPDGDYQIQINVTPSTTSYRYPSSCDAAGGTGSYCTIDTVYNIGSQKQGWNSSFTFGNLPSSSGSQVMTDNDLLVSTGMKGSGIAGDGRAGTIDISVTGDTISIDSTAAIGFQVDTIFQTAGGNFAQHLDEALTGHPLTDMSGTVDAVGNMTFTPTGRLGTIDGPNPDIIDRRWNVNDVAAPSGTWQSFTTGTVTTVAGSITGTQVVNVGPTLNGDAYDDFQAVLVQGSQVGRDWETFAGVAYYETWKVDIVSVNVANLPPVVALSAQQDGAATAFLVSNQVADGNVTVDSNATDGGGAPIDTYAWTINSPGNCATTVGATTNTSVDIDVSGCAAGDNLTASVVVSDTIVSATGTQSLQVANALPNDPDLDGVQDDGTDLDPGDASVLQTTTVAADGRIQVDKGELRLGLTALCAGNNGTRVTEAEIFANAGAGCTAPGNTTPDTITHVGGINDFRVSGIATNDLIKVVLTLSEPIPASPIMRTYRPVSGWATFTEGAPNNVLESAPGALGNCPSPGDMAYVPGLQPGSFCVQMTVKEGGANDSDGTSNAVYVDPVAVGSNAPPVCAPPCQAPGVDSFDSDGGCSMNGTRTVGVAQRADLWLLAGALAWMGWRRKTRQY